MSTPAHGMAYIAPEAESYWDVYTHLQQQNERKRLLAEQKKKEQEAHEAALVQYLTKEWDDKEIDSELHNQVAEKRKQYADLIKQNPNMKLTDLAAMMQGDLADLSRWNNVIKQGREAIKMQGEDYKKYGNIKYNRAMQIAMENLLYDQNKQRRNWKDIAADLANGRDFFDEALQQFPKELLKDTPTIESIIKDTPTYKIGDSYSVTNSLGKKDAKEFTAELYPFQEIVADEKGERHVATRFDKDFYKSTSTANQEGKKIADKDNFNWYMGKRDQRMQVEALFNDYNQQRVAQGLKPLDKNSEEAEFKKREIVFNILDAQGMPKGINRKYVHKDAPAPNYSYTIINNGDGSVANSGASQMKILYGALNGEEYDSSAGDVTYHYAPDAKGKPTKRMNVKNILTALGDIKVKHIHTGEAVTPTGIYYNPSNRGTGYRVTYNVKEKDREGNLQTVERHFDVPKSKLKEWMLQSNRLKSNDGNFTKPDAEVLSLFGGTPRKTTLGNAIRDVKVRVSGKGKPPKN